MRTSDTHHRRRIGLVSAAAALVMLVVAGCSGSTSSPTPTSSAPATTGTTATDGSKPWIVGLMDRKGPPETDLLSYDGKPLVQGFVIQVLWKDVQPDGPGDFDTAKIDQQLAFAKEHDLPVRMRVYAGYNSPAWVLKQGGSLPWQGAAGNGGPKSYTVPVFWGPAFQSLYRAFDAKLGARYDPVSQVREVVAGMCTTNFAEPFIRQFNVTSNTTQAKSKGYTDASNEQCLRKTIDFVKADWPTTNMAMAFNPYQSISATGSNDKTAASASSSVVVPKEIATYCIQELGQRCVLGNNSMKSGTRGASYTALYAMMSSLKAPIYIQTATNAKITDWKQALRSAVQIGALSIELPVGYTTWDRATLQSFNAQLQANQTKL
ncbi:MAG: hypothetical protein M3Y71_06230 [Actinomycetota bacterium]|nr:hypothetical protein [Actinomycetota bacterium]